MNWFNRSHHKAFHEGRTTCTTCGRVFTRINQLRVHHQRDPCGLALPGSQADLTQSGLAAQAVAEAQAAAVAQAGPEPGRALSVEQGAREADEVQVVQALADTAREGCGAE